MGEFLAPVLLPEGVEYLRKDRARSQQGERAILECILRLPGLLVLLFWDMELDRDAGVQDQRRGESYSRSNPGVSVVPYGLGGVREVPARSGEFVGVLAGLL